MWLSRKVHLREVELEWIICAQTDVQARLEKVGERIALIREEERVVTKWAHRKPDLA
jgi:hypothetical protein